MQTRFILHRYPFAAALACAAAWCQWSVAAEPAVNADAYAPLLKPAASSRRLIVTQIVPAAHSVAQLQGAQPGQSTVPSPSATVQPTPPPQGAQPGQSTIPSPSSTPPSAMPVPGAIDAAPAPGVPPAGMAPTIQQTPAVIAPGVRTVPQVIVPPAQGVVPPQQVVVPPTEIVVPQMDAEPLFPPDPLLDDVGEVPALEEQSGELETGVRVRPYGGGHPTDWPWGCNGSPYRTGPGMCDDWRVGCRWHVTADGIGLLREDANLAALETQLRLNDPEGTASVVPPVPVLTPTFEQFDYKPGGRITLTSQVARYTEWDVQIAYEGVPEWNASIVYPKLPLDPPPLPPPGSPTPPLPTDVATEQRSLHYTSILHSGELNILRGTNPEWRPYFGVRYIKFDDEINDFYNQEAPPPLPEQLGPTPAPPALPPTLPTVTVTDRLNLFDVQNNLVGFQIGMLHDTWRVNNRFAIEGFVNGGVYYNRVKYTNLMGTFTTQFVGDNLDTVAVNETRIDFSDTVNNDVREYAEMSYVGEASLTGILRLNKCWALRGGYQALWIANVHLAEDAYLRNENVADDLLFHGWHAGIECRR